VSVAFASNAVSRHVREAGFELDVFRVEGFPRRPGPALARALGAAALAVPAAVGILRRRRPDVVLGGGGYVAGPIVLAAGALRIPAALTEADAHLGLANRLAGPFARRIFLA
jgi:UDP-N-acetylglucosamine--N-acetylmuramyl-(pentapeptide) pyrophosphoryl-undecaprenol N-acetylglucosamine transferase